MLLSDNYEADIWYVSGLANLIDTAPAPKKAGAVSIYIHFSGAREVFIYTSPAGETGEAGKAGEVFIYTPPDRK